MTSKYEKWLGAVVTALLISILSTQLASADALRIAYVDADKILLEAPQGQQALKKLAAEFKPRDNEITVMANKLQKLEDEYKANLPAMSSADRRRQERAIVQLRRQIKQNKQKLREDYNWQRNEELTKLQKLVSDAIAGVAKEEGYQLIIDDKVYVSPRLDITKKVLEKLAGKLNASNNTPIK